MYFCIQNLKHSPLLLERDFFSIDEASKHRIEIELVVLPDTDLAIPDSGDYPLHWRIIRVERDRGRRL